MSALSADDVDAVLPQTQCRQCGFDGCRPYAEAIAAGSADIDRCPPGGEAGVVKLAAVSGRPRIPLDPACGATRPLVFAVIDETLCIGCTLCIQACPVDAIVGGAKRMHTVVAELCTGCELCVPPCPVDCIALVDAQRDWTERDATQARRHHRARLARLARLAAAKAPARPANPEPDEATRKRAILDAAIARAAASARRRLETLKTRTDESR